MSDIFKMIHDISVKVDKETNKAVLGEIRSIAKENGVSDEIVLNEGAIVKALVRSQKRKVEYGRDSYCYCPTCKSSSTLTNLAHIRPRYCPICGQALDWEV